ncbi:MAG: sulfatase-like hydrolase/transferase [Planctomycetaceae bacterium]|nr:sulfatase-like hydrolase/transferase [Planctomycetaceae bacterium]
MLLLVSDDQRPDTIHALGNELIRTPHLDALVQAGSSFRRATCANPICTPSRAEILTGCSGFECGVMDFGKPIRAELPTIGSWFRSHGYTTCYTGKWHNDGVPVTRGYSFTHGLYRGGGGKYRKPQQDYAGRDVTGYRGWIFQDDDGTLFPEKGVGLTPEISRHFADSAIEVIRESGDQPFLLHVNFTSPHDPLLLPPDSATHYDPQQIPLPKNFLPTHPFDHGNFDGRDELLFAQPRTPEETRREIAAYYAVITYMDQQIGRILQTLQDCGKSENTIVIFTSDHGVGLGSHGLRGKQNMYDHTIGVPLIMAGPGIPVNRRFDAQCCLRDLFPTLCDLTGIPQPERKADSFSLSPVLSEKQAEVRQFVTGYFRHFQRMIRTAEWKYIAYPEVRKEQLFRLSADPDELQNLADDPAFADIRNQLRATMTEWFTSQGDSRQP